MAGEQAALRALLPRFQQLETQQARLGALTQSLKEQKSVLEAGSREQEQQQNLATEREELKTLSGAPPGWWSWPTISGNCSKRHSAYQSWSGFTAPF